MNMEITLKGGAVTWQMTARNQGQGQDKGHGCTWRLSRSGLLGVPRISSPQVCNAVGPVLARCSVRFRLSMSALVLLRHGQLCLSQTRCTHYGKAPIP